MGCFRSYDSLKKVCKRAGLDCPDRITSVSLRKYMATISQVLMVLVYSLFILENFCFLQTVRTIILLKRKKM